jgi:hypothetical protein
MILELFLERILQIACVVPVQYILSSTSMHTSSLSSRTRIKTSTHSCSLPSLHPVIALSTHLHRRYNLPTLIHSTCRPTRLHCVLFASYTGPRWTQKSPSIKTCCMSSPSLHSCRSASSSSATLNPSSRCQATTSASSFFCVVSRIDSLVDVWFLCSIVASARVCSLAMIQSFCTFLKLQLNLAATLRRTSVSKLAISATMTSVDVPYQIYNLCVAAMPQYQSVADLRRHRGFTHMCLFTRSSISIVSLSLSSSFAFSSHF